MVEILQSYINLTSSKWKCAVFGPPSTLQQSGDVNRGGTPVVKGKSQDDAIFIHTTLTISTLSLTVAVAFSDQQSTGPALYHSATIRTATGVSPLMVRVCGTVGHRTSDEKLDYLSEN